MLSGLSPKENREIPPLKHEVVHQLKRDFPTLEIIVNGGIRSLEDVGYHLERVDGVMMGREAYRNPYLLSNADALIFTDEHPVPSRRQSRRAHHSLRRFRSGSGGTPDSNDPPPTGSVPRRSWRQVMAALHQRACTQARRRSRGGCASAGPGAGLLNTMEYRFYPISVFGNR